MIVRPKAPTAATVLPDGTYLAQLTQIKQFANTYGERLGFEFTIQDGPHTGQKVMRSTAPHLTRQSKLAEVISGIRGRELSSAELQAGLDLEELLGQACQVLVLQAKSKNGQVYSNVERVFAA